MLKPSLIAPFAGLAVAFLLMTLIVWLVARRSPAKVNRVFRRGQLVSGGFVALTHGTNDAQKTMGIIALALVASGDLDADFTRPPTWVIVSAALAMSAGTYAGGWRIIRTLGTRIAKIDPPQGFAAQTACASILWTTAHFGYPVSTTHVISGSVMGSGATRGLHAVRWGVAGNIVLAWIFTIPMAGLVGASMELVTRLPAGVLIVFALAVADLRDGVRGPALGDAAAAAGPRPSRAPPSERHSPDLHRSLTAWRPVLLICSRMMSVDATELAALPVFDALSPKELERLAAGADRVEIGEPGVELTTEGDFGHSVFVVLEGSARVSVGDEVVRDVSPGDLFGEVAVLSSGRRTATVVSLTPMVLASVFKRDVWEIEETNAAFAAELRRLRAEHV